MIWNDHSKLVGTHALLSPSSSHTWLNYTEDKLYSVNASNWAKTIGTILHEMAADLIKNRIRLNKTDRHMVLFELVRKNVPVEVIDVDLIFTNFQNYVNDAIMYHMDPEVVLYVSPQCFGTADSIIFYDNTLRIHDLKTGSTPAHIEQLETYAALFCSEYKFKPSEISIELRLYQNNDIIVCTPDPSDIVTIMDIISKDSKLLENWNQK